MYILEKLERLAAMPQGSEMPDWLSKEKIPWDVPLRELFAEAADEIKRLRAIAGAARADSSFREIKSSFASGSGSGSAVSGE